VGWRAHEIGLAWHAMAALPLLNSAFFHMSAFASRANNANRKRLPNLSATQGQMKNYDMQKKRRLSLRSFLLLQVRVVMTVEPGRYHATIWVTIWRMLRPNAGMPSSEFHGPATSRGVTGWHTPACEQLPTDKYNDNDNASALHPGACIFAFCMPWACDR
jgi:hypothetical protein